MPCVIHSYIVNFVQEGQVDTQENKNHCCCVSAGDKNNNSKVKCVMIVLALLSVILIPFLISHLLYKYVSCIYIV